MVLLRKNFLECIYYYIAARCGVYLNFPFSILHPMDNPLPIWYTVLIWYSYYEPEIELLIDNYYQIKKIIYFYKNLLTFWHNTVIL